MVRRLVTTWYGTFLVDDAGEVLATSTFPKSSAAMAERLRYMREGEVLDEERAVAPKDGDFEVGEDRLLALDGAVRGGQGPPEGVPSPVDLGYPPELLREASLELATTSVREALPPDQPVILYLRAMDLVDREGSRSLEMLRYWHSFHFPELGALVDDVGFLELVCADPDREAMLKARPELDPGMDSGRPLAPGEGDALRVMAGHVLSARREGSRLREAVEETVREAAPNLTVVAGPLVGARLISQAGSLERLSRLPSSTVQLLGAERALFLHIKEGAPAPKHGVIFQHPSVHSAPPWLRGRIARTLAGKISIAARADAFDSRPDGSLGQELREQFLGRVRQVRAQHPEPPPGWRRRPRTTTRGGRSTKGRGRKRGRRPQSKHRGKRRSKRR
jgi:nucleolar protein 56